MSGSDSDTSSIESCDVVPKPRKIKKPVETDAEKIREKKLANLANARKKATEALKLKSEMKRNQKEIADRERLLRIAEQRKIKEEQSKRLKKLQKEEESESSGESEVESKPQPKPKKKVIKKPKKYSGKELKQDTESESEPETDSDSESESELVKKVVKKRAKKERNNLLKNEIREQVDSDKWRMFSDIISGRSPNI